MQAQKAPAQSSNPGELLLNDLATLTKGIQDFSLHVTNLISTLLREQKGEKDFLQREGEHYLSHYSHLCHVTLLFQKKVGEEMQQKSGSIPITSNEPVEARSISLIRLLHLTSELTIRHRLEEIRLLQHKDMTWKPKLESGLQGLPRLFDELVARLNLFFYMVQCIEKEGVLPANIMYTRDIPQTVTSPFQVAQPQMSPEEMRAQRQREEEARGIETMMSLRQRARVERF